MSLKMPQMPQFQKDKEREKIKNERRELGTKESLKEEASTRNKKRPIIDKILGKNKLSLLDVAHERKSFILSEYRLNLLNNSKEELKKREEELLKKEEEIATLNEELRFSEEEIEKTKTERDQLFEKISILNEAKTKSELKDFVSDYIASENITPGQLEKEYNDIYEGYDSEKDEFTKVEEEEKFFESIENIEYKLFLSGKIPPTPEAEDYNRIKENYLNLVETQNMHKEPEEIKIFEKKIESTKKELSDSYKKLKEINGNKIIVLALDVINPDYDSERLKKLKEVQLEAEYNGVDLYLQYCACDGSRCDGSCGRHLQVFSECFNEWRHKEVPGGTSNNESDSVIISGNISSETGRRNMQQERDKFLQNKNSDWNRKRMIDKIMESETTESFSKKVRDLFIKHVISNKQSDKSLEKYYEVMKSPEFNGILDEVLNSGAVSEALMFGFLEDKISLKKFLEVTKDIDSEFSEKLSEELQKMGKNY